MGSASPLTKGKRGREKESNGFFGSNSIICFAAGDGAQRYRGNWSKTVPQPNMGRTFTCCHLQHNLKTKLHSILLVRVNDGLVT